MVLGGGHASGNIFTWDISRPAKPFLHTAPVDRRLKPETDGHGVDVPVLHLGIFSTRHPALVPVDHHDNDGASLETHSSTPEAPSKPNDHLGNVNSEEFIGVTFPLSARSTHSKILSRA